MVVMGADGGHLVKVGAGSGHWVPFVNAGRGGWVGVVSICLWIVVDAREGKGALIDGGWRSCRLVVVVGARCLSSMSVVVVVRSLLS